MVAACPTITAVPCLRDNYAWLLTVGTPMGQSTCDQAAKGPFASTTARAAPHQLAVVVDPGEAAPVIEALLERNLRVHAVLATHHHRDHVGGIAELLAHDVAQGATVFASTYDQAAGRIPKVSRGLADGEKFALLGLCFSAIATPGHTKGAICYHVPAAQAVFTGDTLFLAGCGRLLEGTAAEQWASLQRLAKLPAATRIYCGHEYTCKNLAFAAAVMPHQGAVAVAQRAATRRAQQGLPTVPGLLSEELETNPFLRAADTVMMAKAGTETALASFAALRAQRDDF